MDKTKLHHTHRFPASILPVLQLHLDILREILGPKLTGMYLHGSAAMGGFSFEQSDVDYLGSPTIAFAGSWPVKA